MQKINQSNRGLLILIGGAEDKRDEKIILKRILAETQAKKIIIMTTASAYPRDVYNSYYDAFRQLGIESVECFDIRHDYDAEREEYFRQLEEADLIFFGGGDQTVLVSTLINTRLYKRMYEKFRNGELHFAGTSAGAAAASDPMLYDGDYQGFIKGLVCSTEGFGFLKDIAVDTHFLQRERIPRLSQFLISSKTVKGIGLDEDTGIIVYPDDIFEVIGTNMVTVMNSARITNSNFDNIEENQVINFNNLKIGFLSAGTKFSLRKWSILRYTETKKNINRIFETILYNE